MNEILADRVDQQRHEGMQRRRERRDFFNEENDSRRFCIIARPSFRLRGNNGAENSAALHLRRLFLLLCRRGVKRALGLRFLRLRSHCGESAMIRDRDPGRYRNRNTGVTCNYIHPELQSLTRRDSQTFSSDSVIGAIGAEGMLSGGTTSGTGPVEIGRISGCSTRVAMSIAVNSRAPARK
jgi:hypothetical protein